MAIVSWPQILWRHFTRCIQEATFISALQISDVILPRRVKSLADYVAGTPTPVYLFPKSTDRPIDCFSSSILMREGYSDGASIMKTLSWYVWPFWKTRVTDRCNDRRTDVRVRCTHECMCCCVKYHTATCDKFDVCSQANHNWLFFTVYTF